MSKLNLPLRLSVVICRFRKSRLATSFIPIRLAPVSFGGDWGLYAEVGVCGAVTAVSGIATGFAVGVVTKNLVAITASAGTVGGLVNEVYRDTLNWDSLDPFDER